MSETPLALRLRDIAAALGHEAAVSDRLTQADRLEEMAGDLQSAADELSEHVAQTRQVYDLFAALLLVEFRTRGLFNPLDAVSVIEEADVDKVRDTLQAEIHQDLVGNYIVSLVERQASSSQPMDGRVEP